VAENRFLQSPFTQASPATDAPSTPPLPEFKALPARNASSGPLTSSAATVLSKGLLPPPDLQPLFEKYSAEYGVPLNVLSALAQQESRYNPNAVGEQTKWGKAKGMLQNLDANAKSLGIDPFDAEQSIAGAARQMRERMDKGYSMEDVVKAHFGGDNREQWGEKTKAYGQEVLAKSSIIGSELMAGKKAAAPAAQGTDLSAIQAEMDAKEPGRYKVIDPADIAERDQQRASIASGKDALKNAQAETGAYEAPSPLTLQNQQAVEDKVNSASAPSPLTPTNQSLVQKGMAPVDTRPEDGFVDATGKQLKNFGPHMKDAVAGLVRMGSESIDNATLVGNAGSTGIIERMQDNGDIIMVQNERGQMTPTLRDGKPADEANLAAYIRKNAGDLMSADEAGALIGMKPRAVTEWAQKTAKQAKLDTIEVRPDGPLAKYGSMIIGSTAEMIPALAASAITRNPGVGMSLIGGQVTGQSYNKGRAGGLNAQDAGNYALAQGMAEAIPEALPIHVILQPGQNFFKGLLKGGAAESVQEGVTQIIQDGLDKGSIDPNMTWAQARQNLADAMIVGAGAGVALKAGVHGIQKGVDTLSRNRETDAAAAAQEQAAQPEFAPTGETQQTQAPEADLTAENPAPAPTGAEPAPAAPVDGPLTRAAQKFVAPEPEVTPTAEAPGEPVTVRSSDGEMVGTLQDYQDLGQGKWSARVLADDGNAYDFTQDDGVQLDRGEQPSPAAPSIPTTGKVGKIPTLTDVVKPGVEIQTLTEEVPTLTDVVEPAPAPDYSSMDVPQLRTELKVIATAIKADPKNKALTKQRSTIEKAIKANVENAISKPAVAELVGDKIDKEWSRFADDSGSLNIPRADMPQIKAEHRGALANFLSARGVKSTHEEVPAASLKPTQMEFSPAKVKKAMEFTGGDRSILVSKDGHVLDGHHQWLSKLSGNDPVKIIRLDAPISDLISLAKEFPSSTVASGGSLNASPSVNLKNENAPTPKNDTNSDLLNVDGNQEALQQSKGNGVQQVRRSGSDGLPAVDAQLRDIPVGRRGATEPEAHARQNERKPGLRAGERSVGDEGRAGAQPKQQRESDIQGQNTGGEGLGRGGRIESTDAVRSPEEGLDGGARSDRAAGHKEAAKPLSPQQKAKARAEAKREAARERMGGIKEGDQFIPSVDVGYITGGETYTVDSIDSSGNVYVKRSGTNSGTHLSHADFNVAEHKGVTFTKVEAPTPAMETPAAPAETAKELVKAAEYGASNKLVSTDRAAELRAKLKAKLNGSQLNSGIDPEILAMGTELAVFHIEAGVRKFAEFAKTMAEDLGQPLEKIRPYLRSWYNGSRDMIEDAGHSIAGMDSADTVRAELVKLDQAPATTEKSSAVQPPAEAPQALAVGVYSHKQHPEVTATVSSTDKGYAIEWAPDDVQEFKGKHAVAKAQAALSREGYTLNEDSDAASTSQRVEPDRADATPAKPVDERTVPDESGAARRGTGEPGASDVEVRADGQRDQRVPTDGAATGRESGDQRVHQPDGAFRPTVSTAGGAEPVRGDSDRNAGEPVERERAEHIVESAPSTDAIEFSERLAAQKKAAGTKTVRGDKANIDAALPLLLEPQRDDVLKAEQRFAVGNGMLLTNGTGTGKTASGMGVIVRSINAGKPNALVIVPSDKIASDWVKFAKMLGVELKMLESTSDNGGTGPVITTYANFGANDSLAQRDWDQFVADEAHYLSSNEAGEGTGALARLQALSGHHDGFYQWVRQRNAKEWGAYKAAMNASRDAAVPDSGFTQTQKDQLAEAEGKQRDLWEAIEKPAKKAWQERWAKQQDLPKTLFLSATPFAYVKSVDYAEGYLFDYVAPAERYSNRRETEGAAYNSGDAREKFFMQHFGYRMRYNKLTAPEAGVDSELMEQNFNQHLKDIGALSGRRLEVPYDYDRKFVMVDDAVGQKIDQGLAFLREHADGKYRKVYDAVMATFDYQRRMYLLESIKARAVVPMINEHLKLGRKVVVFHDYNKGGGFDPFASGLASITEPDVRALAREAFAARPDIFKKMDLKGLFSPIDTLSAAFPDALFFNGTVPKAKRRANADTFNDDNSGKDLIVLQSDAGREGVSLHDTSGKHMRVLINLGMPGKPVAAIQIEGRTYRTGQASDAAFRYLTTGTAWEASAFASKIAERASTAENLALGTDARGLKQSFIDAYNGAEDLAPSADDGKGGKAIDRELAATATLSPFNKAKAYYFAQQKNSKRRDQREGVDYFATPEPVGFKMAEWANIQKGDDVLEPSAGHGAIARFFPPQTNVTMVEPSYDLSQRAALANGQARIINDTFESLHLTNKYDAIVMNPPYGNGGKTAIEHVAKAAKHLREGGRIVALIPRGGLTDKRLAAFLESEEAQDLHRVATFTMPASTFERAGTSVNTQVIVLEKHSNPDDAQNIHARTINLDNAQSTGELFDRIEHLDLPDRMPSSKPEVKPVMIEHVTGKGKTLTGIVRTDLTKDEAKEIDPYTFPKNGGFFIRSKYLGDGNRLSVAAPTGDPASHQEVRDAITQGPFGTVVKKLIDSGNIVVHGNVQSLPDGVTPVTGMQAVTTPDGKVHLVAANLTPGNANGVLLHEMFHSGGETLVGSKRWAGLMSRLDGLQRQAEQSTGKARAVFDRARERVQQAQAQGAVAESMSAEEFGAYAIEEYEQLPKAFRSWVDDLVGAIKHWLFSRYGKQLGQVTPAQLRAMAKDALISMALAKRGELFGPAGTMFSVRPSKVFKDLTDKQKSFLDKIGPEKLPQVLADRWRQLTDNLGLRIRQAGVDRYASLLRNDKALYGAETLEGSIADSSWVLARMSPAAGGAVHALLNNGRIYRDADQKVIDIRDGTTGLGATLRKLGSPAEIDRFMGWIAANRSKRLLGEGRENLFTPDEIEAGIKLSAGKLLDGKPRGILYQQAWKEFQQHRDDVLGIAEATGIITPEQRATWSDEFYVPFYRVIDSDNLGGPKSGGGGLSRQQAFKKLKGGRQHLNDLLENTLLNFHHLLQASLRNQAAAMAMTNAEQLSIADKTTEARRDKNNSTFVMVDGEKQWYNVSDPLTFKAVTALSDTGMNNVAMRVMRGFKRFFTNMTTITPQFVVANAIRDTLSAMATSPTSAIPLKTAFKGALTYGNNHQRARMMASGGAFSFGHVYGQGAHEMKVAITGTMRSAQVLRDPKLIPNILLNAWRKYHDVTDFAENMNRAGIWEHNKGKGKLKAAFEARDLMDFSAHGDAAAIRFLIDVVPFLNARIQGLDKLYRTGVKPSLKTLFGKGSKSDKQAFARFAAVIGALTAFSVMLYLRNKDDEDYRKLEDWQRDTYWVIKVGGNMFFIPKPFEVGSIATMGERLMEQFVDPTVGGDKLADRALHMLKDTFSMNPMPQAFKPIQELSSNENSFTGRPIEDQSMARLSPSLRARPETTRLAEASSRGIESALELVGAGNSALSPVQIDHLIQGYLGAVGTTAIGTADTLWRRAQGEELPARSWDEYQPVKRFYKDLTKEDNYTRYGTDFYTALKKSDQAYADLQHLAKYGEEEKAVALEEKKGDVLALRTTLNKVNRDMSRINAEMKRVQVDKEMDGKTKRLELDQLRSMRNLMTEEIGKDLEQMKMSKRASAPQ
jgi:hypothetical protein